MKLSSELEKLAFALYKESFFGFKKKREEPIKFQSRIKKISNPSPEREIGSIRLADLTKGKAVTLFFGSDSSIDSSLEGKRINFIGEIEEGGFVDKINIENGIVFIDGTKYLVREVAALK